MALTANADCTATEQVGNCVYISAAESSGKVQVRTCDITNPSKMPLWGLIIEKPTPTTAVVIAVGPIDASTWTPSVTFAVGQPVVIGFDGRPTTTAPVPGLGQSLELQALGMAHSTNKFVLSPSPLRIEQKR